MGHPMSYGLQQLLASDAPYTAKYTQLVRHVENLSSTELKEEYTGEYDSWKNRKSWAKKHGVPWSSALNEFRDFLLVNGPIPHDQWTLDRIDPKGHYLPENLRWASKATQSQNRTSARLIAVDGDVFTISDIAHRTGRTYDAVRVALDRHGDQHARDILDNPIVEPLEVLEHRWQFPEEYRPALEELYARRVDWQESRLRFFGGLTRRDVERTRAAYSKATDPEEKAELEREVDELRRLHNDAVRYYLNAKWKKRSLAFERAIRLHPELAMPKWRDCDYEGEEYPDDPDM
jgi:hypothetical protein